MKTLVNWKQVSNFKHSLINEVLKGNLDSVNVLIWFLDQMSVDEARDLFNLYLKDTSILPDDSGKWSLGL